MNNKYLKNKYLNSSILVLTLALFKLNFIVSCVEPIKLRTKSTVEKLVVEGQITNSPDVYKVRLTMSANYGTGHENINSWLEGALVSIVDDLGQEFFLEDNGLGFYTTKEGQLRGEVGRSYKLRVKARQKIYESIPEILRPAPTIDSIYYVYKDSSELVKEGFYTYINFKDDGESDSYYRWDYERFKPTLTCGFDEASGLGRICCEPVCFEIFKCFNCMDVMSDQYFNGQSITEKLVTIDPYDGRKPVVVKVYQQSITKEAYKYLSSVIQQGTNSGSVFDTPPFPIKGNIFNINDPEEEVFGYFGVAGESIVDIKINREGPVNPPRKDRDLNAPFCPPGACPPCAPCEETESRTQLAPLSWYH